MSPQARQHYQELTAEHRTVVPVVGAGLSAAAGVVSFPGLVDGLLSRARAEQGRDVCIAGNDLFGAVDTLAAEMSEEWVQQQTASLVSATVPRATPALLGLTHVRSGLILTTNYDDAIERAAARVGRPFVTLTIEDLDRALEPPGRTLRVLHAHGTATDPSSIVLTSNSYAKALASGKLQLVLRDLGIRNRLVFLGHRLAEREEHLRRDLRWVLDAIGRINRHLLVSEWPDTDDDAARDYQTDLERHTGIRVVLLADPDGRFEGTIRSAAAIAGPSSVAAEDIAGPVSEDDFDPHYVPLAVTEPRYVETDAGQGEYMAQVMFHGEVTANALDATEPRLAIVAGAGMGKSEELRQIGRRSHRPALLQPLTAFHLDQNWADPVVMFTRSMHTASGVVSPDRPTVPRLTVDRVRDDAYVFLFDALDEVAPDRRPLIVRLVTEISHQFPQHRYVLASRPNADLDDLRGFVPKALVSGNRWLPTYLERRSITQAIFDGALPADPGLQELMTVPIFAAAAADEVAAGRPIPDLPIHLVSHLADRRADPERVGARPQLLRCWLDRLALLMQITGVTELRAAQIAGTALHADLPGFAPTAEVLQYLASKALLSDSEGTVRFMVNVLREARAARHLLAAGLDGLEMLRANALLELHDVIDGRGRPVRGVRSSWVNLLELLLPAAPPEWRAAVSAYDPLLAARTTPHGAPVDERDAAVWTLWRAYEQRRIWIGGGSGPRGNDQSGLTRLLRAHVPDGFVDALRAALSSPERTSRGNAIAFVPYVLERAETLELLRRHLRDTDPVVRRRAATTAYLVDGNELVDLMVDQAQRDADDMAAQTLLTVAVDLAPTETVAAIALGAPPRHRDDALRGLTRRLSRDQLLYLLSSTQPFSRPLLSVLVDRVSFRLQPPWEEQQVLTLADITSSQPDHSYWQGDLLTMLQTHPATAARARLRHPGRGTLLLDIAHLAAKMTSEDLQDFAAHLASDQQQSQSASADEVDEQAERDQVLAYIHRQVQPRAVENEEAEEQQQGGGAEFTRPRASKPISDSSAHPTVIEVDAALTRLLRLADNLNDEAPFDALEPLQRSAEHNIPLTDEQTQALLQVALQWPLPFLIGWLAQRSSAVETQAVLTVLPVLTDHQLLNAASVLSAPWPDDLSRAVLNASNRLPAGHHLALRAARAVAEHDGETALRQWVADTKATWADTLLAELGDPQAELRLLRALVEELSSHAENPCAPGDGQLHERRLNLDGRGWLHHIQSPEAVDLLSEALRQAHKSQLDIEDTREISSALTRSAGLDAARVWETLIDDPELPGAALLHHERQGAIQQLLDAEATPTPDSHDLQEAILRLKA